MPVMNPNAYTGNPLERASEQRKDETWIAEQLAAENGRMVVFWKGKPLIDRASRRPVWVSPALRTDLPDQACHVLLGWLDGVPYSAIDISAATQPPQPGDGEYVALRDTGDILDREDLAILGQAAWLLDWNRRHRFCPRTGRETLMRAGGMRRVEPEDGIEHYPRVDPVAIVLPVHEDHCLVGRSPHFPPTMYSALAGFVEPGETLEECAVREIREEVGVGLGDVRYIFSQPWPFPASLMIGFIATAKDRALRLDEEEIEAARWVSRTEMAAILRGERRDDLSVPSRYAIARQLIEHWVAGH